MKSRLVRTQTNYCSPVFCCEEVRRLVIIQPERTHVELSIFFCFASSVFFAIGRLQETKKIRPKRTSLGFSGSSNSEIRIEFPSYRRILQAVMAFRVKPQSRTRGNPRKQERWRMSGDDLSSCPNTSECLCDLIILETSWRGAHWTPRI